MQATAIDLSQQLCKQHSVTSSCRLIPVQPTLIWQKIWLHWFSANTYNLLYTVRTRALMLTLLMIAEAETSTAMNNTVQHSSNNSISTAKYGNKAYMPITACIWCTRTTYLYSEARITRHSTTIERRLHQQVRQNTDGTQLCTVGYTHATQQILAASAHECVRPYRYIVEYVCAHRTRTQYSTRVNTIESSPKQQLPVRYCMNASRTHCSERIRFAPNTDCEVPAAHNNTSEAALDIPTHATQHASIDTLHRLQMKHSLATVICTDAANRATHTLVVPMQSSA